jgi:hypothetical protein
LFQRSFSLGISSLYCTHGLVRVEHIRKFFADRGSPDGADTGVTAYRVSEFLPFGRSIDDFFHHVSIIYSDWRGRWTAAGYARCTLDNPDCFDRNKCRAYRKGHPMTVFFYSTRLGRTHFEFDKRFKFYPYFIDYVKKRYRVVKDPRAVRV